MAYKLVFCFSVLLVQCASSQYLAREPIIGGLGYGLGWGYDPIGPFDNYAYSFITPGNLAASCGGAMTISSVSPIAPTGLTITSENAIEGSVAVVGQLPFLGAVATDGAFNSAGAGAVVYGCGDGSIGIVSETPSSVGSYGTPITPISYGSWNGGYKGLGPFGCGLY